MKSFVVTTLTAALIATVALIATWSDDSSTATANAATDGDACARLEEAKYVGAKNCKKCHFKQHMSWKKTTMAKTFETLKPGQNADTKKKFGLDPQKDYTKDVTCLECHTVGYGKPGGYPKVVEGKAWTDEETKRAALMEGVQCESCHGPGSLTGPFKKANKQYKKKELMDRGMIEPDADNCKSCHNSKSPTQPKDYKFDMKELTKDPKKIHKHAKLKYEH